MLKLSIYSEGSDKYMTRLRLNNDLNKKRIIRINITVAEYTNLVYQNRSVLDQIKDGDYKILDYDSLKTYISDNIYKIDCGEIDLKLRKFLKLLPAFQREFVINWRNESKKICFLATPILLEKIKLFFEKIYNETEFVSFSKLQQKGRDKKAISLVDNTDYLPCIDVENNCIYDMGILLSKNIYVVRKDIILIRIADVDQNINLV